MSTKAQIKTYIDSLAEPKRAEMQELHQRILNLQPRCKQWFLDGKDEKGKVVTNPNIGYGLIHLKYTNGSTREFYQIGLSANTSGISVYIMGIADKKYLPDTFGKKIGKASVTGYCIKFKKLEDIDCDVLLEAVKFGFHNK